MITLGIETSCDETALALIETRGTDETTECRVIASLVHSQAELHSAYGGVYPNLAKREHGRNLVPLLHKLLGETDQLPSAAGGRFTDCNTRPLEEADRFLHTIDSFRSELQTQNPDLLESLVHADFLKNIPAIDRIAVTEGPGLEPALWVGITFARVLSEIWQIPVVPVNHMEGHIVGSLLDSETTYGSWQKLKLLATPALALLISGGHTELVKIDGIGRYAIIGQTKDDAVGEAFDKVARLLGLPYPGGPHVSKLSHEAYEQGIPSPVKLPRPMIKSDDLNFSFSGLKTAVLYAVRDASDSKGALQEDFKKGLAHEFESAVSETLEAKLRKAIESIGAKTLLVGGGVSANHMLRERFRMIADEYKIPLYLPSTHISGDNALMIALAGSFAKAPHHDDRGTALRAHGTKKLGS